MKKLILTFALAAISLVTFAQSGTQSVMPKIGYQTEYKRFMLGAEYRYSFTDNIRVAPDVMFWFPKNQMVGLDINVNVHYVLPLTSQFSVYPLAGVGMLNYHQGDVKVNGTKIDGTSFSKTNFGFNLGAGAEYNLSAKSYVDFQFRYVFTKGSDPAEFMLGYGVRF